MEYPDSSPVEKHELVYPQKIPVEFQVSPSVEQASPILMVTI